MIIITSNKKDSRFSKLIEPPSGEFVVNTRKFNREFSIILDNPVVDYPNLILTLDDIKGNLTPTLLNTPSKLIGDIIGSNINWNSTDIVTTLGYSGTTLSQFNLYEDRVVLLSLIQHGGEIANVTLTIRPVSYLSTYGYSGSRLYNTLQLSQLVDVNHSLGSYSMVTLDTHLSFDVGYIGGYSGDISTTTINTYKLLSFDSHDSSYVSTSLNTYLGIELGITSYCGDIYNIDLTFFKLLPLQLQFNGDNCFVELTENLPLQLHFNMIDGEYSNSEIQITPVVYPTIIYDGSNIVVDIKEAKPILLSLSDIYTGSTSDANITQSMLIDFNSYYGSIGHTTLNVNHPSPIFLSPINDGTNNNVQLVTSSLFQCEYSDGSINYIDTLNTIINTGTELPMWCSELVNVDALITSSLIHPIISSDNSSIFELTTTDILGLDVINCGEAALSSLMTFGPPTFEFTNYYGGSVIGSMCFSSLFGVFQYNGSILNSNLNTREPIHLSFLAHCGQSSTTIQPEIKVNSNHSGAVLHIIAIGNEQFWKFRAGSVFSLPSFTTTVNLNCIVSSGSMSELGLQVKHSEGLGIFNGYSGEFVENSIRTMIQQTISVLFKNDTLTTLDIDSAVYFDLMSDGCCGKRPLKGNNSYIIELDNAEYPDEVFYGNIVKYSVVLSVSSNIEIPIYNGSHLSSTDKTKYFDVGFYSGSNGNIKSFEANIRNRLCNGYFIPSGNNIITELTEVISEDCNSDMGYMGETLSCKLTPMIVFQIANKFDALSSRLDVVFETYRHIPWNFNAYSGEVLRTPEFVRISIFEPSITFECGSTTTIAFPESRLVGYSGECHTFVLTTSKISIDFIDIGCLVNEYHFRDDLGNIIQEKYTSVALELYPFEHQLKFKPRCVF